MRIASRSFVAFASPSLAVCLLAFAGCRTTPEGPPPQPEFHEPAPAEPTPRPAPLDFEAVYFDYDSAALRDDARATLKKNAGVLRGAAETVVTLEGHCDERGSEEYNLALGERRADSVRRYLVDLGIPNSRLRVVSFGEAKPAVMGHDESAWRWNRRVEAR